MTTVSEATKGHQEHNQLTFQDRYEYYSATVNLIFFAYLIPLSIAIGTALNIMTLAVLVRRKFGKSSTRILLIVLAVADLSVLYFGYGVEALRDGFGLTLANFSNSSCKFVYFAHHFFPYFSHWNVMLLTIERWISVSYPLKARFICTARLTSIALFAILVLNFGVTATLLIAYRTEFKLGVSSCLLDNVTFYNLAFIYRAIIKLIVSVVVPFLGIITCNISILYHAQQSRIKRKQLAETSSGGDCSFNAMTKMLVTVSLTFILFLLPDTVNHILKDYIIDKNVQVVSYMYLSLTKPACKCLVCVNHSINFILYCVSGSQFRREFFEMIDATFGRIRTRTSITRKLA
jgi:hypothetical protein